MVTVKLDDCILGALTDKTALWLKVLAGALYRKKLRLLSVGEQRIIVQQENFMRCNALSKLIIWFEMEFQREFAALDGQFNSKLQFWI